MLAMPTWNPTGKIENASISASCLSTDESDRRRTYGMRAAHHSRAAGKGDTRSGIFGSAAAIRAIVGGSRSVGQR